MELTQEQIDQITIQVFNLMESNGMLPGEQLDLIAGKVKRLLQLDSTGVDEVPVVDTVDGVTSLPCVKQSGSVYEIVRLPVTLLEGMGGTDGTDGTDGIDGTNGTDGKNAYLRSTGTELQWRLGEDGEWERLILLSDITGATTLGSLTNVDDSTDSATNGSLFVKVENEWSSIPPILSPQADYDNMLMPVYHRVLGKWVFISVSSITGGVTPPVALEMILNTGVLNVNKLA